jgi:putative amide transporter protein
MATVGLLYVGAVLFINGVWLLGWVKGISHAPMDLFVGLLQVITPTYLIFTAHGDATVIWGAAGLYLFGFTYLYVAMNAFFDLDGTGLGWYCLFVVFCAVVFAFYNFRAGGGVGNVLGVLWANWAFLWLLFWLLLSMGMDSIGRFTGAVCATQGIITGLIPALLLLDQASWVNNSLAIGIAIAAVVLDIIYFLTVKTKPAPAPVSA